MTGPWAGHCTSYRIHCSACDAETVVRDRDLDATVWDITSLHFHEGRCPDHRGVGGVVAAGEAPVAADGGQPTLEAFGEGDEL